jgi:hypothetical protein
LVIKTIKYPLVAIILIFVLPNVYEALAQKHKPKWNRQILNWNVVGSIIIKKSIGHEHEGNEIDKA